MTTIEERVEAGAAWLDANRPGWVDRINLRTLDLGEDCGCVLGQVYGDWLDRPDEVNGSEFEMGFQRDESQDPRDSWDDLRENWDDYCARVNGEYDDLTTAWRDYITARRAA